MREVSVGTERAPLQVMACTPARGLASRVAERLRVNVVPSKETWFACGEGKFEIGDNVRGTDLYLFQNVLGAGDSRTVYERFVMLLHAIEAASLADAQHVTAVIPYFPGARQDKRKDRSREGISAGLFARCLQEAGAQRVISIEIHNEAIAGMFDPGVCRLENLYLYDALSGWLRERGLAGDVVASPDVGGAERARHFAESMSSRLAVLSKVRDYSTANRVLTSTLIGEVRDADVLLVDDIVDTAGSVVAAVDELKTHGARDITVACAHPVMSPPAWERLTALAARAADEGWRFRVVGTSSIDHTAAPDWYSSYDVAELLARVIRGVNTRGSVTRAQRG